MSFFNVLNSAANSYTSYNNYKQDLNVGNVSEPIELERIKCRNKIRMSSLKIVVLYIILPIALIILMLIITNKFKFYFYPLIYFILVLSPFWAFIYLSTKQIQDATAYYNLNNDKNIENIKKCNY